MVSRLGDMLQIEQHAMRSSSVTEPGHQGGILAACWVPTAKPVNLCLLRGEHHWHSVV